MSPFSKRRFPSLGYSAGSTLAGLHQIKQSLKPEDFVILIFHDHGSRYLGKIYNDDWMRERGFLNEELTVKELIRNKKDKSSPPKLQKHPFCIANHETI